MVFWVFLGGFFIANPDFFLSGQRCCRWAGTASAGWTGTASAACASCAGSTLRTTRYPPSGDRPSRISGRGRRAKPYLISLKSDRRPLKCCDRIEIYIRDLEPELEILHQKNWDYHSRYLNNNPVSEDSGFGMNIPESVYKDVFSVSIY